MLEYLLGVITGIAIAILNIVLIKVDGNKIVETIKKPFTNSKATVVDMSPDVDLGI